MPGDTPRDHASAGAASSAKAACAVQYWTEISSPSSPADRGIGASCERIECPAIAPRPNPFRRPLETPRTENWAGAFRAEPGRCILPISRERKMEIPVKTIWSLEPEKGHFHHGRIHSLFDCLTSAEMRRLIEVG